MSDLVIYQNKNLSKNNQDIEKYFQDSNAVAKVPKVICTCHTGSLSQLGFQKIFYVYDEACGKLRRVTRTVFSCNFCHKIWPFIETVYLDPEDDSIDRDLVISIPRYPLLTKDFFSHGGYYGVEYLISPFENRRTYPVIIVKKEGFGWSDPYLVEIPANNEEDVGKEELVSYDYLNDVHKNILNSLNFKASDGLGLYKDNPATTFSEIDYRGFMIAYRGGRFNAKVYLPLSYSSDFIIKSGENALYYPEKKMLAIENQKYLKEGD